MTAELRAPAPGPRISGQRKTGRIAILDGFRLLAATMVVFYHYAGVPNAKIGATGRTDVRAWGASAASVFPHWLNAIASTGWTGVELFFMISGFVICMSGWGRRPADFFVSRVVRLVPAYWAGTLLTAAVLISFPRLTSGVRISVVLTNMTMVQSAYGVPNLVPAYWTLFVELTFYLLFGLVAIWGITYRRMVTFCVLWSVASLISAGSHQHLLNNLINPRYAPYFVAGIALFLIHKFGGNLLLWAIVAYSWLIAVNQPNTGPSAPVIALITAFFVVMSLVATHRLDRIQWRWLPVAGALTYPLYLIHQDIGFTAFAYLRGRAPAWVIAGCTYLVMLAAAWVIHRGIERTVGPVLKRKLSAAVDSVRKSGAQAAAAGKFGPLPVPAGRRAGHGDGNVNGAGTGTGAAAGRGNGPGPAAGTSTPRYNAALPVPVRPQSREPSPAGDPGDRVPVYLGAGVSAAPRGSSNRASGGADE